MSWLLLSVVLCAGGPAQESPVPVPGDTAHEESTCQPILQEFNQMKLLSLQADPVSGAMRIVYGRLVHKHLLLLWLFTRAGCNDPLNLVKAAVVDPSPKECPEGVSCL